jgi:hypothetical protein
MKAGCIEEKDSGRYRKNFNQSSGGCIDNQTNGFD